MKNIELSLKKYNIFPNCEKINNIKYYKMSGQNEVYRVDIDYNSNTLTKSIVLKLFITQNGQACCKKELKVLKVLKDLDFPVPKVMSYELTSNSFGKPFIITEYIDGVTVDQAIQNRPKSDVHAIVRNYVGWLLKLHELDLTSYFPEIMVNIDSYFDNIIKQCIYRVKNLPNFFSNYNKIIDWFIIKRKEIIPSPRLCLVHGDLHFDNCIIKNNGQMVFLDWADSRFQDYRIDLGLLILNGYERIHSIYQMVKREKTLNIDFFLVYLALQKVSDYYNQKPIESKVVDNSCNVLKDIIGV